MTEMEADPRRLAAVVFDDQVSIDLLLVTFVERLRASHTSPVGFIQLASEESGCGPSEPMRLVNVATPETMPLCAPAGSEVGGCRLDPRQVRLAAQKLHATCGSKADLVLVPRFGRLEARGQGFRAEMADIVESGHILLTAVRRGLVPNWYEFTGGVGTVLEARLWVLEDWWRDVSRHRAPLCA